MTFVRRSSGDERGVTLVELLVVMALTAIIGTATVAVVQSATATERFTHEMRTVMDDARIALGRVRKEIRAARIVMPNSTASHLDMWVDQNQDNDRTSDEMINFCVRPVDTTDPCVDPSATGQFDLVRWTDAQGYSEARVAATTLRTADVFSYQPAPEETRLVTVTLALDLDTTRGPQALDVSATVRLRNID